MNDPYAKRAADTLRSIADHIEEGRLVLRDGYLNIERNVEEDFIGPFTSIPTYIEQWWTLHFTFLQRGEVGVEPQQYKGATPSLPQGPRQLEAG